MKEIVIATYNAGKLEEIRSLLADECERFYSLSDLHDTIEIIEDSPSYAGNAMKKARKVGGHWGMASLADDSGLEVEALGGNPGVHSSRYGSDDDERISRLLRELEGVPWEKRNAVFKAYVALYLPTKERCYIFYGELKGYIGFEKHGTGGFGYDPIFYSPQAGRYLAELTKDAKNRLSHRGVALRALKNFINVNALKGPRVLNL